jgi:hypothetical protein
MSCAPSSPCDIVLVIYVGRPGYAKHLAGSEALLAPAMHGCRAWRHHRTQRHHRWPAQMCQLPCRFRQPCLSGHCPSSSLSLPSLRWRTCPCCIGITASIALTSLSSSHWRHRPSHAGFCPIAMPLATHCRHRAGVFAGAALASLPASCWRLCRCCAGILASIALAPLPALRWRCCPHCAGITARIVLASSPSTHWRHCLCRAGVITLVALASAHWQCCSRHILIAELASLPALRRHPCKHRAGVVTVVALALLPLLCWPLCPCAGATASIALASLPLRWRHCPCSAGVCPIATLQHVVVIEVASLLVLHWHPREHRAGVIAGVCWHHRQHCAGVFALVALASFP